MQAYLLPGKYCLAFRFGRMPQMTEAAFQTEVSLNKQATDPKSHSPSK